MNHLIMDRPQCLLYSAAMVFETDVEELTRFLGHDGLEVVDDTLPEPNCFRGIHPQEICDFAWSTLRSLQYIQAIPMLACDGSDVRTAVYTQERAADRFYEYVEKKTAILTGLNRNGNPHAVAYDGNMILDPVGKTYGLDCFQIKEAWVLI